MNLYHEEDDYSITIEVIKVRLLIDSPCLEKDSKADL